MSKLVGDLQGRLRRRACFRCLGLFEAESRYNLNGRFAADLLQTQLLVILRPTFGCRTASNVERHGGEFVDLHQCEGASAQRTKTASKLEVR